MDCQFLEKKLGTSSLVSTCKNNDNRIFTISGKLGKTPQCITYSAAIQLFNLKVIGDMFLVVVLSLIK